MSDFVEVYEFIEPDVDNREVLRKEMIKDCKHKNFSSFGK